MAMPNRDQAEQIAESVGFEDGCAEWETAVELAMRGWPAWRIAQHFNKRPELIHELERRS